MRRFVVLTHDYPVLHWDLMLEKKAALRTWRLAHEPDGPGPIDAEELPDHRLAYLDYEGAVSGGRGTVRRFDRGEFMVVEETAARVVVELEGKLLRGRATLEHHADSGRWSYSCAPRPGPLLEWPGR